LKAELRVGMRALDEKLDNFLRSVHEKLDRVLVPEQKVEEHSKSITRIKTWWSALAAGIALSASLFKDWVFRAK